MAETPFILIVIGFYSRVYPYMEKVVIVVICNFVIISLLKLGWNIEVVHSKQLARLANMLFVNFIC